jgi:hypothetical protein
MMRMAFERQQKARTADVSSGFSATTMLPITLMTAPMFALMLPPNTLNKILDTQ